MKPKQGTPSWISGGFLGKGYTLQGSSGKKSPAGWHCTKGKVYPQTRPPPPLRGPGAPGAALSVPYTPVLSGPHRPARPPGKPSPSPRAGTGVCAGGASLPPAPLLGAQRADLGWGRQGEQIQEDLTHLLSSLLLVRKDLTEGPCWSTLAGKNQKVPERAQGVTGRSGAARRPGGLPLRRQVWALRRPLVHAALG